jgi:hypothetical protein
MNAFASDEAAGTAVGASEDRQHDTGLGGLLPCPFCGQAATVEPDRWRGESVRIACANDACPVRPRTEYLLPAFAGDLRAAWNGRPRRDGDPG